ncbi:MAG TPA: efflux RND transporter permease subunit, partial [Methylomirabilota bacterium]|nr:efflux RND transporter permease subunit [Methylomirabilota bacterium]
IGMLVDNSIVVIENIFRHREKGLAAAPAAALGTEEVQRAITASTLSTVAVFGPIIYVEGVAGELFAALSFAVAFTLLASLGVAVTLLPTMAARWEGEKVGGLHEPSSPLLYRLAAPLRAFDRAWERVAAFYERSLQYALEHRGRTIAVSLALLAVTVPFALDLERSVLPDVDQGEFRVRVELELGTALEATTEVVTEIEQRLLADPDVDAVFSRVGKQLAAAGIEEDQSGLHTALLDVRLKSGRTTPPVLGRIRQVTTAPPGGTIDFETGQATALGRLLGGGEADLAVRIRGDDLDAALAYAGELRGRLVAREELMNVRVGTELGQPEYLIQLDRDRAASYGLDARTVAATIENYMRGNLATQYVDFDRKIDIYVRLPEDARRSLETLDLLRVQGIPLRELVTVREAVGPVEIRRIDQARIVPIFADVAQGGLDEAVAAVRAASAELPPPEGLRIDVGGENEEMQRGFRDLALAFTLAILLVYMILAAEFESLLHPFTVLLSVPLGLIGAILALWLAGAGLNVVSLIGLVILVGIVDNDAVIKIAFINQLRGEGLPLRQAVLEAGKGRLRPIVMNSITTMLAITPMMLGLGAGASLQAPLAIAIFGGLFTSTALTLIVIPVVYELVDGVRDRLVATVGGDTRGAAVPEPAGGD